MKKQLAAASFTQSPLAQSPVRSQIAQSRNRFGGREMKEELATGSFAQSQIAHSRNEFGQSPDTRHFAWQLFSVGTVVRRNGKELYQLPVAVSGIWTKAGCAFAITGQDLRDMV